MLRSAAILVAALMFFSAAPAGQVVPDSETFLREARETLRRSLQFWHRYAYKERRTDVHVNPFGRMGTGDVHLFEVYPSPRPQLTYKRAVERNGRALSKAELDRQDAEYRVNAREVEQRLRNESGEDRRDREQDELVARRRAQTVISDVLDTLRFEVVRREMRNGVPTVVIAFAAKPNARPTTRQGRIAKIFKGNAWVHEASREVVHVDAVAVDDVSFGGFIAKLYEGTRALVERKEIDHGVWMPTRMNLSGDVRALFRKAKIEYVVEWFDYRRMDETSFPFNPRIEQQPQPRP